MKRHIIRTDISRADIIEILSFISQDNPRAARDLLRKFNDRLELLSDFPGAGVSRPVAHVRSGGVEPALMRPCLRDRSAMSP